MWRKLFSWMKEFTDEAVYYNKMILYWEKEMETAAERQRFCFKVVSMYRNRLYKLKGGV